MTSGNDPRDNMRRKLIGLGERSMRKSYYPELKAQMKELERFHALLEEARDAILLIDGETHLLVDCNATTERMTGIKEQDLIGAPVLPLFHSDFLQDLNDNLAADCKSATFVTRLLSQNAEVPTEGIPVEISVRRTRFEGKPFSILVARDISRRQKAEDEVKRYQEHLEALVEERTAELQDANTKLQESLEELTKTQSQLIEAEKMASLATLVAGVAHEINTPLGTALTAVSSLESRLEELTTYISSGKVSKKELLQRLGFSSQLSAAALNNMHRASELVQSFKQVSVDQNTCETRMFNVCQYVNDILLSMRSEYARTTHTIDIVCAEDIVINSSPSALTQIISNFIMNSLVHGFHEMENGRITIHFEEQGENIIITYTDNGNGMEQDTIDRIFDPFFSTRTTTDNTGLGMHIVYNIITQQLGGHIEVQSKKNAGVMFTVAFPKNTPNCTEPKL